MAAKTLTKPKTKQLLLVSVSNKYDPKYGAACFDAEPRWMPLEKAERFNPGLRAQNTPIRPQLSGREPPSNMDLDKLKRFEQQLSEVPSIFPVQRPLGRTFKEAGIWLVTGSDVLTTSPVIQDKQGAWDTKKGVEWVAGPYFTIAEARAKHPEIPPADVAPTQEGPKETPETLALRAEVKKLRDTLAAQAALHEGQQAEGAARVGDMNSRVGKQHDETGGAA